METTKKLGIWIDHSSANLIDFNGSISHSTIETDFTHESKVDAMQRSENLMHNKRQQMHEAYYKKIADQILKYDHVLLFGPTNAKSELFNYLSKDLHFKDIKIDVESADKMSDNEKNAYVKQHFNQ